MTWREWANDATWTEMLDVLSGKILQRMPLLVHVDNETFTRRKYKYEDTSPMLWVVEDNHTDCKGEGLTLPEAMREYLASWDRWPDKFGSPDE